MLQIRDTQEYLGILQYWKVRNVMDSLMEAYYQTIGGDFVQTNLPYLLQLHYTATETEGGISFA